ncbi:DUF1609 domain-containing protein [Encephalitozoon hellem]|uniref:DUF1609 domain-containing protein n=1 Tax=Encephalitozoon hellem TaxID=27973 RepID=A0ABY8CLA1_ENCHE|nr:DUF1609 domain-containing protein [Encephalitozoon hellem]
MESIIKGGVWLVRGPMRLPTLEALILLDRIWSSLMVERVEIIELEESKKAVVFPLVFSGANAVVLPNTRFRDLKRGTGEEMRAREFVSFIGGVVLSFTFYDIYFEGNSRFEAIFKREMEEHIGKVSEDIWNIYIRGKNTLSEILEMAYNKVFQCDEKSRRSRRMTVFGKCIIDEANKMIGEIADDMDKEVRDNVEGFCNYVKSCGEKCCDVERWRQIVRAESIVCNASVSLYSKLPEEELLGLLAEGCTKKILKKKGLSEEELSEKGYVEYNIVDIKLFLDTYDKHGSEVIEEIVRQMMLGKDGREIDAKYVEKVVRVVDERRRRREIEASRHAAELLGEELSGKKSKGKAKGKKSKKKSGGGG